MLIMSGPRVQVISQSRLKRDEVPILIADMLIYNIGSLCAITGIDNEKDYLFFFVYVGLSGLW